MKIFKRSFLKIIIMILFSNLIVLANDEYEVINTSFNNDIILSIYPVEKPDNDISLIHYVIRTSTRLLFCDSEFNIVNERYVSSSIGIINSKMNRYFIITKTEAPTKFKVGSELWTVIDYNNNEFGNLTREIYWDSMDIIRTCISDNSGYIYELDVYPAKLTLWDNSFKLIKNIYLFDEKIKNISRRGELDISKYGNYIAVSIHKSQLIHPAKYVRKPYRGPNAGKEIRVHREGKSGEPTLLLLTQDGDLLFYKQINNWAIDNVNIINEKYIITSSKTFSVKDNIREMNTDIFDTSGKLVYRTDFLYKTYSYVPNKQILLSTNIKDKSILVSIDVITKNVAWERRFKKNILLINIIDEDVIEVLTGQIAETIKDGKIYHVNLNGDILSQQNINYSLRRPQQDISESNTIMLPTIRDGIYKTIKKINGNTED